MGIGVWGCGIGRFGGWGKRDRYWSVIADSLHPSSPSSRGYRFMFHGTDEVMAYEADCSTTIQKTHTIEGLSMA